MRIGIIGGGIAGLTAAYELGKQGHTVSVFERDNELGGQAGTFVVNGERIEKLYHHIFMSDKEILDQIAEVGLSDQMEWLTSRMGIFYGNKIYYFGTPMDALRLSPLSFFDRIRFGLITVYLMLRKEWRSYEKVTAMDWIRRNGGRGVTDVIWGPLLRGKFGDRANEVSMTWLWGKIHLRGKSRSQGMQKEQLGYMKGSYQKLIDALEARILSQDGQVFKATTVQRVMVEGGRVIGLEVEPTFGGNSTDAAKREVPFDAILATVPSPIFLKMVPELPAAYADKLRSVDYQSAVVAVLELDRQLTDIYWMNMSDRDVPFVGAIEHTNFVSPARYGDTRILYLSNYLARTSELYALSDDDLVKTYIPHLKKLNPAFDPSWIKHYRVFRDDAGQPIVTLGYSARIPEYVTPIVGLYLGNTTQIYPEDRGMNYSVRLGQIVAKVIHERDVQPSASEAGLIASS